MAEIRVGILGYGNLGRGAELALQAAPGMELSAVFSRREPQQVHLLDPAVPVVEAARLSAWRGRLDVLLLCGGSAADLPVQGPQTAGKFSTADSFDTHRDIPAYFEKMDGLCKAKHTVSVIAMGWDPGLFSIARTLLGCALPNGTLHTFWGRGVSQGHSDAIRRIPGVIDARQYTVPIQSTLNAVRAGSEEVFVPRQMHRRECYVVAQEQADQGRIAEAIRTMPGYFADYDTDVYFISLEELKKEHSGLPHGGRVLASGATSPGCRQRAEFCVELGSNPEFTGALLVAGGRAAARLAAQGRWGAYTPPELAPALLSPLSPEEIRRQLV